jgi:hypothetical protein
VNATEKRHDALGLVAFGDSGSELAGSASRAVIGTLRPTERRRAMIRRCEIRAEPINYVQHVAAMELTGIEPVTSAVRLQRSPS